MMEKEFLKIWINVNSVDVIFEYNIILVLQSLLLTTIYVINAI